MRLNFLLGFFLVCAFTLSARAQGMDQSFWDGTYTQYPTRSGSTPQQSLITVSLNGSTLMATFIGDLWYVNGQTLSFACTGTTCYYPGNTSLCAAQITLESDGTILLTDGLQPGNGFVCGSSPVTSKFIRYDGSYNGGGSISSTSGSWEIFRLQNTSGAWTEVASVKNPVTGTQMNLSCQDDSAKVDAKTGKKTPAPIQWSIQLTDKMYLAAKGAKASGDTLSVRAWVNGNFYLLNHWHLEGYDVVVDKVPVALQEQFDFRKGLDLHLSLSGIEANGKQIELGDLSFSLTGSNVVVGELQNRCDGTKVSPAAAVPMMRN